MNYEIKGGSFPIVECTLGQGQKMITQSGSMCWMDATITMDTTTNGGIKKVIGRAFSNENLFQNVYTSMKDGSRISFGTCVPGAIMPVKISEGQSIICQKSAFLAAYGDIDLSIHLNKKIGVGFFGGEGFIMQKISGNGIVFLEIDGSSLQYELAAGQQMILSTGYLVSMSESCQLDVQTVKGIKNMFLGGEGIFNTVITGPGRVITQTMPLARLADSIIPFIPTTTTVSSSSTNSTVGDVANAAGTIFNMFNKK